MRLGMMQPYFFPYLEHFRLMAACDLWVVFDTVGYRRKTWMTRNRVLDRNQGWGYIRTRVHDGHRHQRVDEVRLDPSWVGPFLDRLRVYEHHAPHHAEVRRLVDGCLHPDHDRLVDLNVAALTHIGRAIGITTPIVRLSDLRLDLPTSAGAGEWALLVARALGATEYRNPVGGVGLFDERRFADAGIELTFHDPIELRYDTAPFEFQDHLSILDPLMWIGRAGVADHCRPPDARTSVHPAALAAAQAPGPSLTGTASASTSSRYAR